MTAGSVLVTGVGGPAGRGVAAMLVERGHSVVGVDMAQVALPGVATRRVPAAGDREFLPALRELAERAGVVMVIPTVSEELSVLAGVRLAGVPVVVGSYGAVVLAADKWLTSCRLAAAGIPIPRFALAADLPEPAALVERLGLPYLSKPRIGRGGRGVTVHDAIDATALRRHDRATILQEFVPGAEYAANLYIAAEPRDDLVVVLKKTALAQGDFGNALAVRRVEAVDVARIAVAAAREIGLAGPVDVDVRRRADETPVVLEVNARFGAHARDAPEVLDALLAERLMIASAA